MSEFGDDDLLEEALQRAEQFPEAIQRAAADCGMTPGEYGDFQKGVLSLYRGETSLGFEETFRGDRIQRPKGDEVPLYFTDSKSSAKEYAQRSDSGGEPILMNIEVPGPHLETTSMSQVELEGDGASELEPETVYYAGPDGRGGTEWVASSIPREWAEIEHLGDN